MKGEVGRGGTWRWHVSLSRWLKQRLNLVAKGAKAADTVRGDGEADGLVETDSVQRRQPEDRRTGGSHSRLDRPHESLSHSLPSLSLSNDHGLNEDTALRGSREFRMADEAAADERTGRLMVTPPRSLDQQQNHRQLTFTARIRV